MTNTNTAAEFETALAAYLEKLNAGIAAEYARLYPNIREVPTVTVMRTRGAKYMRLVRGNAAGTDRSAHGFVEIATGRLFKADGWKGPAKNFARGSIFDVATWPLSTLSIR